MAKLMIVRYDPLLRKITYKRSSVDATSTKLSVERTHKVSVRNGRRIIGCGVG